MGSSMARYAILAGIDLLDNVVTTGEVAREVIDPCRKNGAKNLVRTLADVVDRFAEVDSGFTTGPDALEKVLKKWGRPPNDTTCRQIFSVVSRLAEASGLGPLPWPIVEQMLGFDAEVAEIAAAAAARDDELAGAGGSEAARASALQTFASVAVLRAHGVSTSAPSTGGTGLPVFAAAPTARLRVLGSKNSGCSCCASWRTTRCSGCAPRLSAATTRRR